MNFKIIATYDNYLLANMTMGLLTENDIKCQMKDEHIVTVDPLLNPAVGGIKLLVEEKDFDRAVDLMKEAESDYLKVLPAPIVKATL
jgi:regulatory protein YycI of two-component signal transduction system YycFG